MKEFYIPSLDGLRAIAFLIVFVGHAGLDRIVPGGFGVTMFFFLSGYLITTILRVEAARTQMVSLRRFYLRRAFRILPPLYVALAIGYTLSAFGMLRVRGNLFGFVAASAYFFNYADILRLNAILPAGNGVIWSLMVEEHFYLIFPLAYWAFVRRRVPRERQATILFTLCIVALCWRCCLVFLMHTPLENFPRWTYSASDARFDSILFGCILAIRNNAWFNDKSPLLGKFKGAFASGGLLLLLASFLYREPHFRETLRYTLQCLALYPIFYYCVSSSHQWQMRWLEWKPLRCLGWVSYSMYLFHAIPMDFGNWHYPSHPVAVALFSFALSLAYSWLVRIYVERPSRQLRSWFEQPVLAPA